LKVIESSENIKNEIIPQGGKFIIALNVIYPPSTHPIK